MTTIATNLALAQAQLHARDAAAIARSRLHQCRPVESDAYLEALGRGAFTAPAGERLGGGVCGGG